MSASPDTPHLCTGHVLQLLQVVLALSLSHVSADLALHISFGQWLLCSFWFVGSGFLVVVCWQWFVGSGLLVVVC